MALITDPDFLAQNTSVFINTSARTIQLVVAGSLDNDGVTLKAVYSFLKEEWRDDAALIRFDFPMTPITDEAMQIGVSSRNNGWRWRDDITRKLIRTGGWQEVSATGVVNREYSGIISLGTLTPGTEPFYEVVTGTPTNFFYTGVVNEAVQVFGDATTGMTSEQTETNYDGTATNGTFTGGTGYANGDIITLTNFAIVTVDLVAGGVVTEFTVTLGANATATAYSQFTVAPTGGTGFTLTPAASNLSTIHGDVDYRTMFNVFAREQGDVYAGSTLQQIGVSLMTFQAYRFPLTTAADPKIVTVDGDITTLAPFTGMSISYRTDPLVVEIGDGLFYDFGIVIDGNNGTAEQIYEFVQYSLRQNSDINEGEQLIAAQTQADYAAFAAGTGYSVNDVITLTNGATITVNTLSGSAVATFTVTTTGPAIPGEVILQESVAPAGGTGFSITAQAANLEQSPPTVNGRTADLLLQFVGDTLFTRAAFNPATSTTDGVYITNFQTADINRLVFTDDTGTERVFPFTATLTLNFSATLSADTDATFWVFFTNDDAGDNTGRDFNTAEAILVNDADGVAMTGLISSDTFRQLSYAYDTNVQRGAASVEDPAPVTAVAIGLGGAQYVLATGTIERSNANSIALVAPQERNYSNPV